MKLINFLKNFKFLNIINKSSPTSPFTFQFLQLSLCSLIKFQFKIKSFQQKRRHICINPLSLCIRFNDDKSCDIALKKKIDETTREKFNLEDCTMRQAKESFSSFYCYVSSSSLTNLHFDANESWKCMREEMPRWNLDFYKNYVVRWILNSFSDLQMKFYFTSRHAKVSKFISISLKSIQKGLAPTHLRVKS